MIKQDKIKDEEREILEKINSNEKLKTNEINA